MAEKITGSREDAENIQIQPPGVGDQDDAHELGERQDGTPRVPSGVPGLDELLGGGVPEGRATLISGGAGSGKTLAAIHFTTDGAATVGEGAVYVSFEEPAPQLRRTIQSLGRDVEKLEAEGKLAVIDAAPQPSAEQASGLHEVLPEIVGGRFELSGLIARIEAAAQRVKARRVALDSLAGLAGMFLHDAATGGNLEFELRAPLARLINALKMRGYTLLVTAERDEEGGALTRYGLEEFVADGVVILRSRSFGERRRRTVEVRKLRSCAHIEGESPMIIRAGKGITVLPLTMIQLTQESDPERATSGLGELDRMTGGGLLRDSVILVSGASGTGKTLLSTHFLTGGVECGDKSLLLAYEESQEQLLRNGDAFGLKLRKQVEAGDLIIDCVYPESMSTEAHLLHIQHQIERHRPNRLVIDSLSALERIGPDFAFRQFLTSMAAMVKRRRVMTLLTAGGGSFGDQVRISEQHISTLNDTIILLRYQEVHGRVERNLTVLKMRGSGHAREHRRYRIGDRGIVLSGPRGDQETNVAGERVQPLPPAEDSGAAPPKQC